MKRFATLPLEVYIMLIAPAILVAVGTIKSGVGPMLPSIAFAPERVMYYVFFGNAFFSLFFSFLYVFLTAVAIVWVIKHMRLLERGSFGAFLTRVRASLRDSRPRWVWFIGLLLLFQVGVSFMVLAVNQIGAVEPARVLEVSVALLEWDRALFGTYVPFTLQSLSPTDWDFWLYWGYTSLGMVMSLVLIGLLLCGNVRAIRGYILSLSTALILAIPFWHALPAVTPYELYGTPVLSVDATAEHARYAHAALALSSPLILDLQERIRPFASKPDEGHYHVPTFPSMHIAWGTIALVFAFMISRLIGLVVVPWYLLNVIGASYTLQHYAVDALLGIFVAVCGCGIVHHLLRSESRSIEPYPHRFAMLGFVAHTLGQWQRTVNTWVMVRTQRKVE